MPNHKEAKPLEYAASSYRRGVNFSDIFAKTGIISMGQGVKFSDIGFGFDGCLEGGNWKGIAIIQLLVEQ